MPMILDAHDSLPYIDTEPTPAELEAASALIAAELGSTDTTSHPSISTTYEPHFSDLVTAAHTHLASTNPPIPRDPKTGVDLTRYSEQQEAPTSTDRAAWSNALNTAYTSHTYLANRTLNLSLLEKYGNNAWLIANSQVEDELRTLEKELAETKREVEIVEEERRARQESVRGEVEGLEIAWRDGVGRAIQVEVAAEGLRRQILEKRRGGAGV